MRSKNTPYIATPEDFKFIYQLLEKEGNPTQGMLQFLKVWDYGDAIVKIYNKKLNQNSVEEFVKQGFVRPPKINFSSNTFWNMLYMKNKNFMLQLHKYLKPKGFDLMERFLDFLSLHVDSYKLWYVLPNYIFCLNKLDKEYHPNQKSLFETIEWLSGIERKYACKATISLLSYITNRPIIYNSSKIIDLFTKFTNSQKSIPKSEIEKYENLLDIVENLDKDYWDTKVQKNQELKNRIAKKESSDYQIQDSISRKLSFDIHNLSRKNGNFNITFMKNNFDRLKSSVSKHMLSQNDVIEFNYQNNDAIIIINIIVENTDDGKTHLEALQNMIDVIYLQCIKSIHMPHDEIKKTWENILLAKTLDKSLNTKDKYISKISKI